MSSFFYTTRHAKTSYHSIPSTLNTDDVLAILHSHSTLAKILWPASPNATNQLPIVEEKQTAPDTTDFQIGPSSSATSFKASIESNREDKVVVVRETAPLGLEMTVVYKVITGHELPPEADVDIHILTSLYLQVERSVSAPKPFSFLVHVKEGSILKTRNLLFVLGEMGRNGKDLGAALEMVRVRENDGDGKEEMNLKKGQAE